MDRWLAPWTAGLESYMDRWLAPWTAGLVKNKSNKSHKSAGFKTHFDKVVVTSRRVLKPILIKLWSQVGGF